jgi:hypothetical protein
VQGINDLFMFTLTAIASFSSGVIMTTSGWDAVNLAALPFIGVALAAVSSLILRREPSYYGLRARKP